MSTKAEQTEQLWKLRLDQRDLAVRKAREAMQSAKPVTPQVAGRRANAIYTSEFRLIAAYMAMVAEEDYGLTDEECEHLRYAARFLGYGERR